MLTNGEINWQETLAQIAEEKGCTDLGRYIRIYAQPEPEKVTTAPQVDFPMPIDYSRLSDNFAKPSNINITKMPEATCDGCQ